MIAGPRVLEHMVDTVLYFEGERGHQFRILRAVKNRFGPTDEIGVFEMTDARPDGGRQSSALFLAERDAATSRGSAVFAGIEGTRPCWSRSRRWSRPRALGTPRRAVVGWDFGPARMVLAVLEARCGLAFGGHDVYLNVAGGLRIARAGGRSRGRGGAGLLAPARRAAGTVVSARSACPARCALSASRRA